MVRKNKPLIPWLKALLFHGLEGKDLVRCWVGWQIQPLSIRDQLMCKYNGRGDPMCFAQNELTSATLATCCRKFVAEKIEDLKEDGLAPFYQGNPAPPVYFSFDPLIAVLLSKGVNLPSSFFQYDADFWAAG